VAKDVVGNLLVISSLPPATFPYTVTHDITVVPIAHIKGWTNHVFSEKIENID